MVRAVPERELWVALVPVDVEAIGVREGDGAAVRAPQGGNDPRARRDRTPLDLPTGYRAFLRAWGMEPADAARLCTDFTIDGKIPEPCRVARLVGRATMQEYGPGE